MALGEGNELVASTVPKDLLRSAKDSRGVDWSLRLNTLTRLDPMKPDVIRNYWNAMGYGDQVGLMAFIIELNLFGQHTPSWPAVEKLYDCVGREIAECLDTALAAIDYTPGHPFHRFHQNAEFDKSVHRLESALAVLNTPIERKNDHTPHQVLEARRTLEKCFDGVANGSRHYQLILAGASTFPNQLWQTLKETIYI